MTEKRDLNNELILMKKTIQQAKVCVIGKLVRKLKNLTNSPGKEVTGLKLMVKRKRLTDQINYLKKTPNLELATAALTFDKNPTKIITSQLSSIEDASLAIIVTYKTVCAKVNEIKTKFGLNGSSEEWRQTVGEIGKKKKKKIDRETNKVQNKERKEAHKKHSELVKKRDEWLDKNMETNGDISGTDDEENVLPSVKREKRKATDFIVTDIKTKTPAKKKPTPDALKTADPFFLTGTGETYLATKIVDRVQPHGPNDGLDRKERRAQQFGGAPKTVPKRHGVPAGSSVYQKSIITPDNLHPSWAAKMKSKGIDKFQGKKMKFDDDETSIVVSKSVAPQPSQPKEEQEKIHPSWAAKQKLKPVISEFKGNKIVFDD
ncbi:hypothetical protein HA402_011453 [Bradysia odoriphaga]|nr:hypothetical protein HA402_011453 [Bradysia odoriphaga]